MKRAFERIAALFFLWGFVSANNDPLLLALKQLYSLSWFEALLTHFMFAIAFGLVSIPAAMLGARIGLSRLLPIALAITAAGCAAVAALVGMAPYALVLAALFVAASGIVALQVAANPLAALAGPPERSHWRLNLVQSLNSLGVVMGANFGAALLLGGPHGALSAEGLRIAYGAMALTLAVAGVLMAAPRKAIVEVRQDAIATVSPLSAFGSRWAIFGAIALGLYVGAEVTLSGLMAAYLHQPDILGTSLREGGALLANIFWGGALAGRLAGIIVLHRFSAIRILTACAIAAILLCAVAVVADGPLAGWAALAIGFANSMMFPLIFSITLERSRLPPASVSGLLCASIVGGALLPLMAGHLVDRSGFAAALALPIAAYAVILLFAGTAHRASRRLRGNDPTPPARLDPI